MKNSEQSAFPRPYSHDERPSGGFEGDHPETFQTTDGLTKREYFAIKALQGLLPTYSEANGLRPNKNECEHIAIVAIGIADELLKRLN